MRFSKDTQGNAVNIHLEWKHYGYRVRVTLQDVQPKCKWGRVCGLVVEFDHRRWEGEVDILADGKIYILEGYQDGDILAATIEAKVIRALKGRLIR